MVIPDIGVVIVNWNGGPHIFRVLAALEAQTMPPSAIVVMDNASTDESPEAIAARFPRVKLRRLKKNLGFAAANNIALREEVHTQWVALLNPDAIPATNWIEALWRGVADYPGYWAYGCRMRMDADPTLLDGTGDCYHVSGLAWRRDHGRPEKAGHLRPGEIFSPCAAAALYRRDKLLEIGGFDEDFFCYLEDVDLGFRLRLAGGSCFYLPDAIVRHVGSAATGRKSDFSVYHGYRNLIWCYWKNMPLSWLLFSMPAHLTLNLVLLWRAWRRGQGAVALRAQRDAFKSLPGIWQKRRRPGWHRRARLAKAMEQGVLPLLAACWSR